MSDEQQSGQSEEKRQRQKRDEFGQFLPGVSGNPKGRPKDGNSLNEILRMIGEESNKSGKARKERVARKLWTLAEKGEASALRYLFDRMMGKPVQEIRVNADTPIDAPIHVHVAGVTIEYRDESADGNSNDDTAGNDSDASES